MEGKLHPSAAQCNPCIPNYSMLSNILQKGEEPVHFLRKEVKLIRKLIRYEQKAIEGLQFRITLVPNAEIPIHISLVRKITIHEKT